MRPPVVLQLASLDRSCRWGAFCAVLLLTSAVGKGHAAEVDPAALPAPVKKALAAELSSTGSQLKSVESEIDDGRTTYSVEVTTRAGTDRSLTYREDGVLLATEVELKDTPMAVQKTISTQVGAGTLDEIEKRQEDGQTIYDVSWTDQAGHDESFTVAEAGNVTSIDVSLEQLPGAVQQTIKGKVGGGKLDGVAKTFDEGEMTYDVNWTSAAGKAGDFTVGPKGKLLSEEVTLGGLPTEVQSAIRSNLGNGRLLRIDQEYEVKKKQSAGYEVEVLTGSQTTYFRVSMEGRFLGQD